MSKLLTGAAIYRSGPQSSYFYFFDHTMKVDDKTDLYLQINSTNFPNSTLRIEMMENEHWLCQHCTLLCRSPVFLTVRERFNTVLYCAEALYSWRSERDSTLYSNVPKPCIPDSQREIQQQHRSVLTRRVPHAKLHELCLCLNIGTYSICCIPF